MKRMVKNGDLFDISKDGSATFKGNLKVGGTIIANGEIRGGDVSAGKFYLGTEEMPLVKANPAGDAAGTLEKIKIGDVAYNVGGGSSDREITLILPYPKTDSASLKRIYLEDDIWNKINNCYYETVKLYFNDGYPLGVFNVIHLKDDSSKIEASYYMSPAHAISGTYSYQEWYGEQDARPWFSYLYASSNDTGKYIFVSGYYVNTIPILSKAKFDALYKLADKPTVDGTYVLKATVSGGAVTYTWEPQA